LSTRWPDNIGSLTFLVRVTLDVFASKWFCHVSVGQEHHRFVWLDLKVDHNIIVVSHYCNILVAHQDPIQHGFCEEQGTSRRFVVWFSSLLSLLFYHIRIIRRFALGFNCSHLSPLDFKLHMSVQLKL